MKITLWQLRLVMEGGIGKGHLALKHFEKFNGLPTEMNDDWV